MTTFVVGDKVRVPWPALRGLVVEIKYISADVCVIACDEWNGAYREISLHPHWLRPLDWVPEEAKQ